MLSPYLVDWENINFENSLTVVKALQPGNVMKVLKNLVKWVAHQQQEPSYPYLSLSFRLSWD